MRRRTILVGLVLVALVVLSLGSCRFLGFINPGWALQGSWEIVSKPDGWGPHEVFVFTPGADEYQIKDADGLVFESGPVLNLTDSDFDYQIDENTFDPGIVGAENYATYTLDRDDLTITFYSDSQKTDNFGTISCVRM